MGKRLQELGTWAERALATVNWQRESDLRLEPLSGDAGFRCYYRLNTTPALLAVDAPPATEDSAAFMRIAAFLREQGVHTPSVIAADLERGFLLVEDLGDRLYLPALTAATVDTLYAEALNSLLLMQQSPHRGSLVPDYNQSRLRQEMELFKDWFVPKLLGHALTTAELDLLGRVFRQLEASALEQPRVLVHRDYHSRNLLICDGQGSKGPGGPGVVDFQDAVWGPLTYDLVSLLRDCYICWPQARVRGWALDYRDLAVTGGVLQECSDAQFLRWFDWMGLQRHIKVLGIFARLYLRDHKPGYLQDLPLVMRYTLEVAETYAEFADFVAWFKAVLLPLAEQQHWYSDYACAGQQTDVSAGAVTS